MSNDVVINVKTDTSGVNFAPVERARDSLGRFVQQSQRAAQASDTYRDANGRLRNSLGRFVTDAAAAGESAMRIGQGLGAAAGGAVGAGRAFGSLAANSSGLQGALLVAGVAAVGAAGAFVALAPALLVAAGAAAAAAGAMVGLGNAFGALKIGFGGIGDALAAHGKSMGGAGKAATNTAEQEHQAALRIRSATRALVDAKRAEREAIADVNRARQSEIERLKDLDAAVKLGAVSEKEAALELQEAKLAVQNMDAGASEEDKARMRNRLERAQIEYDETVRRNKGLAEERKKADKAGIDGSDQVQAALERQRRAHEQVVRAQEGLAEAQRKTEAASGGAASGIDRFAEAMRKLSPNARALVRTLIDLSGRWDEVKKRVQDRLLEGFAGDVRSLAGKWLPLLDTTLGNMADRLNGIGRSVMKTLGSKEFIDSFKKASDEGGKFISQVGGGIPALLTGFMNLAASSGPVLTVIGKTIRGISEAFDRWISGAQRSGALRSFMERAAAMLDKIFTIGKLAFQVVGEFIEIIFPSSENTANSIFDWMIRKLGELKKWLQDPENRAAVKAIADGVGEFITWVVQEALPVIVKIGTFAARAAFVVIREFVKVKHNWEQVTLTLRMHWNLFIRYVIDKLIGLVNLIDSTLGRVVPGLSGKLAEARGKLNKFKEDTNKTLDGIRDKAITIKIRQVFEAVGQTIAAVANQLVDLGAIKPKKGKTSGGISGGGLEWVGEHGPELRDLAPGSRVYSNPDSMRMSGGASAGAPQALSGTLRLAVERTAERGVVAELFKMFRAEIGNNYGGDVQLALGRTR